MSCDHTRVFALIRAALEAIPGATIRQISAKLRVHPHTTASIITCATGLRPSDWRHRELERLARDMLANRPTMSVKEVAAVLGLTTNGLRRLLVRRCGLTPTQLRKTPKR